MITVMAKNKKDKKNNKKNSIKELKLEKNNFKPLWGLIIIVLLVSTVLNFNKDNIKYETSQVAINELQQNYTSGKYSEIIEEGQKVYGILKDNPNSYKILREETIIPKNVSLADLGFLNGTVEETKITTPDNSTAEMIGAILPDLLMIFLILGIGLLFLSRMG